MSKFYNDTALYGKTAALMCGYDFFGPEHLLFGTDMPFGLAGDLWLYRQDTIHSIEQMNIPDMDKDKIFEQNAKRLLKLSSVRLYTPQIDYNYFRLWPRGGFDCSVLF